jgi:hypothetical protein
MHQFLYGRDRLQIVGKSFLSREGSHTLFGPHDDLGGSFEHSLKIVKRGVEL